MKTIKFIFTLAFTTFLALNKTSLHCMQQEFCTIPHGESILNQDKNGKTVLHEACEKGDIKGINDLIAIAKYYNDNDATLKKLFVLKDNSGDTALNIACKCFFKNKENKIECAKIIIKTSFAIQDNFETFKDLLTATDNGGKISLYWACFNNYDSIVTMAFELSFKINDHFNLLKNLLLWKNPNGNSILFVACLNRTPSLTCIRTIIHAAFEINNDNFETIKAMLTMKDNNGEICLIPCCPPAKEETGKCAQELINAACKISDKFKTLRTMLTSRTNNSKSVWDIAYYPYEITPCMNVLLQAYKTAGLDLPLKLNSVG